MTIIFLIFILAVFLVIILMAGFKGVQYRNVLWILCASMFIVILFFGLKPKGYRFINQVKWKKQCNGIVFSNLGMIYSQKTLGSLGITDSITIIADLKPASDSQCFRFLTVIDSLGNEQFFVSQWKKNMFIALYCAGKDQPVKVDISDAISEDTVRRVAFGIGCGTLWIGSSHIKKVNLKEIPGFQPHFEKSTLLVGCSPSGTIPWSGELHRLSLSGNCFIHSENGVSNTFSAGEAVFDTMCTYSDATFTFDERSGNRITNRCSAEWDLCIPLFPRIVQYDWFKPLTKNSFSLSKYGSLSEIFDPIINFLGFIPFGAVICLLVIDFRKSVWTAVFYTTIAAIVTSTSIELVQVFIPTRVSQMLDILLNVSGTCSGAFLVIVVRWLYTLKNNDFIKKRK